MPDQILIPLVVAICCLLGCLILAFCASKPDKPKKRVVEGSACTRYYLGNDYHREDGPAVEYKDGRQEWWIKGQRHCSHGPAVIKGSGDVEFWALGEQLTEEEYWKRYITCEKDYG